MAPTSAASRAKASGEDCDGARFAPLADDPEFARYNCVDAARYYSGVSACRDCRFDPSLCFRAEGTLRCTEWCGFDLSGCRSTARCGDGRIDFGEMCEPDVIRSSCAADGGSGAYVCDPEFCVLDQTGCAFTCPGGD